MLLSSGAFADSLSEVITVKDRLRVLLWTEGLKEESLPKTTAKKPQLPEELERPLKKI